VIDACDSTSGRGIAGWVAAHRQASRLDDASSRPAPRFAHRAPTGLVTRSMLCVRDGPRRTLHGVRSSDQQARRLRRSDDGDLAIVQASPIMPRSRFENALRHRGSTRR
jgi:hypothetical protein